MDLPLNAETTVASGNEDLHKKSITICSTQKQLVISEDCFVWLQESAEAAMVSPLNCPLLVILIHMSIAEAGPLNKLRPWTSASD